MALKVGDMLLKAGMISPEQLEQALKEQQTSGQRLGSLLVKMGFVTEDEVVAFLSKQFNVPSVNLNDYKIDEPVLKLIPAHIAQKYGLVPLSRLGRSVTVAMVNPNDILAMEDIKFSTGFEVRPVIASEAAIWSAIDKQYGSAGMLEDVMKAMDEADGDGDAGDLEILEEQQEEGGDSASEMAAAIESSPAAKLVNGLIAEAVKRNATDIHIEPYEKEIRVRMSVYGVLHEVMSPPLRMKSSIAARIKIISKLKIEEKRFPQDGRLRMNIQGKPIDIRVSIIPTAFGEKVALRILDRSAVSFDLPTLGFEPEPLKFLLKAIQTPFGIVLVTGPTGSGKTTTMYACLESINHPDTNIMTAEEPVEYSLMGVNQVAVREEGGTTFTAALKAFLRQDPNIIMVGEIRDRQTAEIAIRSSLTGHLVLSTVHTNSASLTITRLVDMGVEPFMISSSLLLVESQRLVRKICSYCKEQYKPEEKMLREFLGSKVDIAGFTAFRGRGCSECRNTGYKGRIGLAEILPVSPAIRDLILERAPTFKIEAQAVKEGMATLRMDGILKVRNGITTIEEVIKETVAVAD
ncbi:MAG: Flp pilus assembly complex ATPase component TadA [Candidatus Edwardsbacteria bacterium]|nr:Flp pilus assembly complex ATPase component TadA [Candidatus Edwardsbacteria bacterium]MBU1575594.1 Flp pilus assembly complex ATPase component TadA [Candidatus Edwardsbacteria bacterium]MBU2464266.1 Flp pilus assembly complex ATPase component TadA [Candidatus Edwardsbacteria bacterium]MBU2593860.1 Flp pilus assembly complex ATPase component TadA [Candidatus Edwardsbacteria bacterium]